MKRILPISLVLGISTLLAEESFMLTSGSYTVENFPAGSAPQGVGIYTNFGLANGFVANRDDNTVGYFNASDPQITLLGSFSVQAPYWITFSGTTGYVTQQLLDNIVYFDATSPTPQVLGSITATGYPNQMAFKGTVGFVTLYSSNQVGILDTTTNTISGAFSVGDKPLGIMVAGTSGYVCNSNTNSLSYFDASSPTPVELGQLLLPNGFDRPNNLASFGTTGFVSVVIPGNGGYVGYFDTLNPLSGLLGTFTLTGSTGDYPYGLVVNATVNGYATGYVTNVSSTDVFFFDAANPSQYTPSNLPGSISVGTSPFHLAFNQYTPAVSQIGFVSPKTEQKIYYFYAPLDQNISATTTSNWSNGSIWSPPMVPSPVSTTNLSGINSTINLGTVSVSKLFTVGNQGQAFADSVIQESGSVTLTNGVLNLYGTSTLMTVGTTLSSRNLGFINVSLKTDSSVKTKIQNGGQFSIFSGTFTTQGAMYGKDTKVSFKGDGKFINEGLVGRETELDPDIMDEIKIDTNFEQRTSGKMRCRSVQNFKSFDNDGMLWADRIEMKNLSKCDNSSMMRCDEAYFDKNVDFGNKIGTLEMGYLLPSTCEFLSDAPEQTVKDFNPVSIVMKKARVKNAYFDHPGTQLRGGFRGEQVRCAGMWDLSQPMDLERGYAEMTQMADVRKCDLAFRTDGLEFDQVKCFGDAMFDDFTQMNVVIENPPERATQKLFTCATRLGSIPQDKMFITAPVGTDAKIVERSTGYWLLINGGQAGFTNFPGNAGVTANLFNQIDGSCPAPTQNIIDEVSGFDEIEQFKALEQLTPAFKVIQYSLEKLSFALQKDLQDILYKYQRGFRPYLIAGYDHMRQDQSQLYTGYSTSNFYQLAGFSYGMNKSKVILGTGVSESKLKLHPLIGDADYTTVYANTGVSVRSQRWRWGLEGLFGYSFINTNRYMLFLDENATSNHGAWNTSVESRFVYKTNTKRWTFQTYDDIGYIYGIENNYLETGAPGANFFVKNEAISMIRNALGCLIDTPRNEAIKGYADVAFVYEKYLNSQIYQAAIEGTDLFGDYEQTMPAKYYLRTAVGVLGRHKNLEWQLGYMGLFGKRLIENTASFKLSTKF